MRYGSSNWENRHFLFQAAQSYSHLEEEADLCKVGRGANIVQQVGHVTQHGLCQELLVVRRVNLFTIPELTLCVRQPVIIQYGQGFGRKSSVFE